MVLHFRITTQGGVKKELCHPYPLSSKMENLKQLYCSSDIGVAHNGIISLTSDHNKDYNDTMKFITDYLSLIIKDKKFYKDTDKLKLIERLCESKLAILDNTGHCQLIGNFIEDNGVYYSNSTYSYAKVKYNWKWDDKWSTTNYYDDFCSVCGKPVGYYNAYYDDNNECYCGECYTELFLDDNIYSYYDKYYNVDKGEFDFDELKGVCPMDDGITEYCFKCKNRDKCDKSYSINIPIFTLDDGTELKPTGELKREKGFVIGVSVDEEGNEYYVEYDEYEGDLMPYDAYRI
jgi:hypothetical protein